MNYSSEVFRNLPVLGNVFAIFNCPDQPEKAIQFEWAYDPKKCSIQVGDVYLIVKPSGAGMIKAGAYSTLPISSDFMETALIAEDTTTEISPLLQVIVRRQTPGHATVNMAALDIAWRAHFEKFSLINSDLQYGLISSYQPVRVLKVKQLFPLLDGTLETFEKIVGFFAGNCAYLYVCVNEVDGALLTSPYNRAKPFWIRDAELVKKLLG